MGVTKLDKRYRGKNIYILNWNFSYGTASSNRLLAYANSAAEQGYYVDIVAILRIQLNGYESKNGVTIRGLFPCRIQNKTFSKLISFFSIIMFLLTEIKRDDRILLYGSAEYLPFCVWLRGKQTYFEVTECPDLFKPRTYPFSYYKKLWKRLNGIFVISNNLKKYFVHHGVDADKIHVINMIVDSNRFDEVKCNPNKEKYIAYCGNVNNDSKDGVSDLIISFVRYHIKFPDRKLYIIGPIVSLEQKKKYEDLLKKSNAQGCVIFTDSVLPDAIPQYFVDAEMLVLARPNNIQAKYGFPTKLGEYLLSGKPAVLTDVGNITDFLVDEESAYIAQPDDIVSISDKMIQVSSDPIKAEKIGNAGKKIAEMNFNSAIETAKLLFIMFNVRK